MKLKRPECPNCHENDWKLHLNPRGYIVWKGLCIPDPDAEICNICGHIRYLKDALALKEEA